MKYDIFSQDGGYMCRLEIREDDAPVNKCQVNEPGTLGYNPKRPRWIARSVLVNVAEAFQRHLDELHNADFEVCADKVCERAAHTA